MNREEERLTNSELQRQNVYKILESDQYQVRNYANHLKNEIQKLRN